MTGNICFPLKWQHQLVSCCVFWLLTEFRCWFWWILSIVIKSSVTLNYKFTPLSAASLAEIVICVHVFKGLINSEFSCSLKFWSGLFTFNRWFLVFFPLFFMWTIQSPLLFVFLVQQPPDTGRKLYAHMYFRTTRSLSFKIWRATCQAL